MKYQNNRRKICRLFSLFPLSRYLLFAICSLLIASCPNPFNSGIDRSPVDTLPPGMGSFSLTVSGTSRTLMPATPALSDFKYLELSFRVGSSVIETREIDYNGASSLPPVILDPGTYSLTVDAYKGPGKTNLAARGELSEIEIIAGQNTSASVILKTLFGTGTGRGTFKWSITVPNYVSTGSMSIVPHNPTTGNSIENPFPIGTDHSASDSHELNSGVYNVTFDLRSEDEDKTLKWREVVYIYLSLDTIFNINFTDEYFNNSNHTVTFEYNNGNVEMQSVLNGGTVDKPADPTPTARLYGGSVPSTHSSGYEWYGDPGLGYQWNFDTPIHADRTLYAEWIGGSIDIYGQSEDNDVARAIAYINENAAANKEYTLLVVNDVTVGPQTITTANFNLTIQGYNGEKTIQYNGAANSSLFTINNAAASLTLGNNITLEGIDGGSTSLVRVTSGTLVMEGGSKITGHTNSYNDDNSSKGGAVKIDTGGTFNMSGGEISGNSTVSDGSGVYIAGGRFTMTGGEISGNTVGNSAAGGGVYFNSGTFTVGGTAKIFNNKRENGIAKNVTLCGSGDNVMSIKLGTDGDKPVTETGGMEIHVSINDWPPRNGTIVQSGANEIIAECFHADQPDKEIGYIETGSVRQIIIFDIIEMVQVAGGNFQMGRNGDGSSNNVDPVHEVTLAGFSIGKFEVTQAQYEAVMTGNDNGINATPSNNLYPGSYRNDEYPVEKVSWYDALVFCNRLSILEGYNPAYSIEDSTDPSVWGDVPIDYDSSNYDPWNKVVMLPDSNGYRLPTEAQWEYAAKGGQLANDPYKIYSGSNTVGDVAWYPGNAEGGTHEVGKKDANELGIHDMSGNVWEWCWDWYNEDYYNESPPNNPIGPSSGNDRVIRGGGWLDNTGAGLDSVGRGKIPPNYSTNADVGFRVVLPVQ